MHEPYQALRVEKGRQRALPSLQPTLILNTGAALTIFDVNRQPTVVATGQAFYAGLHDQACFTQSDGLQSGIHLRLSPLDAFRLFGPVVAQCINRAVLIDDISGGVPVSRIVVDESSTATVAEQKHAVSREIEWAWDRLATGQTTRISDLTNELGWSRKRFFERFKAVVGIGPKTVARLARFDALHRQLKVQTATKWVEHALDVGYFDQSHMIRDVNLFAGTSPTSLIAETRRNIFPIQVAVRAPPNATTGD